MAKVLNSESSPFHFEGGDVHAKATFNNETVSFKVSSHALSFASHVWKKFIFPPFPQITDSSSHESNKSKADRAFPDIELDFTEDNTDALLILLQIAHLQFSDIPKTLPYGTLLGVAILCDQYDCRRLVKPWIQGWMRKGWNELWNELQLPCLEGWLFIAWYFGRQKLFEELAMTYVLQMKVNTHGQRLIEDGWHILRPETRLRHPFDSARYQIASKAAHEALDDDMTLESYSTEKAGVWLPSGILDSIFATREAVIQKILIVIYDAVDTFNSTKTVCCLECDALHYGVLLRGMKANLQCKLWPRTIASDIGASVYHLLKTLRYLDRSCNEVLGSVRFGGISEYKHRSCHHRFQLFDHALPIILDLPTPVLETHREYMKMVNAEMGILD